MVWFLPPSITEGSRNQSSRCSISSRCQRRQDRQHEFETAAIAQAGPTFAGLGPVNEARMRNYFRPAA